MKKLLCFLALTVIQTSSGLPLSTNSSWLPSPSTQIQTPFGKNSMICSGVTPLRIIACITRNISFRLVRRLYVCSPIARSYLVKSIFQTLDCRSSSTFLRIGFGKQRLPAEEGFAECLPVSFRQQIGAACNQACESPIFYTPSSALTCVALHSRYC